MSRVRPEAYRAHMGEVALSTLLASCFGIVAEANVLVIGRREEPLPDCQV